VDEVLNVQEITPKQVQAPPGAVPESRFISGAVQRDDILIFLLDDFRLFSNNDERMVDKLTR